MVGVLSQPKQIFPLPLSRFMLKAFALPLAVLMAVPVIPENRLIRILLPNSQRR